MRVFIEKSNKNVKMYFKGKVKTLLEKLKINPNTVIVIKNSAIVTEEDLVTDRDSIKILSVISGG